MNMQTVPMTVEDALKAADSYSHLAINGGMVQVLAARVRELEATTGKPVLLSEWQKQQSRIADLETALRRIEGNAGEFDLTACAHIARKVLGPEPPYIPTSGSGNNP
jgi:hypothetical protein